MFEDLISIQTIKWSATLAPCCGEIAIDACMPDIADAAHERATKDVDSETGVSPCVGQQR